MLPKSVVAGFALLLFGLTLAVYGLPEPGNEPGLLGAAVGGVGLVAVLLGTFTNR